MSNLTRHSDDHLDLKLFYGIYSLRRDSDTWTITCQRYDGEKVPLSGNFTTYRRAGDFGADFDVDQIRELIDRLTRLSRGSWSILSRPSPVPKKVRASAHGLAQEFHDRPEWPYVSRMGLAHMYDRERKEWLAYEKNQRAKVFEFFGDWVPRAIKFLTDNTHHEEAT